VTTAQRLTTEQARLKWLKGQETSCPSDELRGVQNAIRSTESLIELLKADERGEGHEQD
jgi:hypothetical protein